MRQVTLGRFRRTQQDIRRIYVRGKSRADDIDIASGTANHTAVVINAGAVPHFVRLLASNVLDVKEQAYVNLPLSLSVGSLEL
jgi:hypothetical protein